ncbi:MAG TPA: hypothetical protein VFA45_13985 [Actinomycetes bacterium]|jgi:hypothetical protein|nr:hypothetical protein [Actinomycetes bacterium]
MNEGLSYFSGRLAQQHLDDLRRDAAKQRLVRSVRRQRRQRRQRVGAHAGLRPATAR